MRLVDGLPPHSRYVAALLDDPDMVPLLAEQPEPERSGPTMHGFDQTVSLLSSLVDAINQNTAATIAAAGAEPPTFEPVPRPVTELDRVREQRRTDDRNHRLGALAALALGKPVED